MLVSVQFRREAARAPSRLAPFAKGRVRRGLRRIAQASALALATGSLAAGWLAPPVARPPREKQTTRRPT